MAALSFPSSRDRRVQIVKSIGVTPTEHLLAELCEQTFLTLWSYPNPFKDDGKELCDLLVVFGDHVFIFFDRESRKFERADKDVLQSGRAGRKKPSTSRSQRRTVPRAICAAVGLSFSTPSGPLSFPCQSLPMQRSIR